MLRVAAETIEILPTPSGSAAGRTGATADAVHGPLKSTIFLFDDGSDRFCLVTSSFCPDIYPISNLLRARLGAALGLAREQIAIFSSHNHSCVLLSQPWPPTGDWQQATQLTMGEDELTAEGRALLDGSMDAARRLPGNLTPVRVAWAVGHERRISHNRKGRRADGSTYFMREEDRVLLGADFNGDIDDDAPLVAFLDDAGRPVCFLAQFTAHPVTAYHPEFPVVFGDYPQVACDDLSAAHGGVPVGFLQGCAGDVNSKGLLAPVPADTKLANATRLGHYLGETYIAASHFLTASGRDDLEYRWETAKIPCTPVPSEACLRADMAQMEEFQRRCLADEEDTLRCVGLNFPRALSPRYRAALIDPCMSWTRWALSLHENDRLGEARRSVDFEMGIFRIGDIAIVGMPCEPFLGIGRQIRAGSALPLTIPCGYMNDNGGYVADAPNLGDREYISSSYRYMKDYLPFAPPGGNIMAEVAVRHIREMAVSGQ